jgi:peptide/nickel transport system substrate-binding protein
VRALVLAPVLALTACGPRAPSGTLFFSSGADLQSINPIVTVHPLAKQVQRYVLFTTLVRYDSALRIAPYLARSWAWSDDRRTLTFTLRDDVRWHDGRPTTSADVAFTLAAARDTANGYPRLDDVACITGVRAPEPAQVELAFCRSQPEVPDVLTDLAILPAHRAPRTALRESAFNEQPVGNGPFRFVSHEPNRRWVFAANPDFPAALGGRPALDRLVIVVVDEATTKLAGLVSGELHFAGILPMHASLVRRTRGLVVRDYPILLTYALVWNTSRAPFDDPALRRALTMALDRGQIVDAFLYGFGRVADGPVPPEHPLAAPDIPAVPFSREGAVALLDSLGWRVGEDGIRAKSGRRLAFTLLTVGTADNVLEQLIQAGLREAGVEVRIRQLEMGAFLAAASGPARDYDALVTGISGDFTLGYLRGLFDSRRSRGPLAYARYANPAVDAAFDRGDLAEVQRLVARDLPLTFLYHARGLQGASARVHGAVLDLRGELATVQRWRVAPAAP